MVIKNGKIVTKDAVLEGYDILVEDGIIKKIGKDLQSDEIVDACGHYVTPGFIDIHTHGGYEADFMDCTYEAYAKALKFHLDNGTTTVVPTSCTAPRESIVRFLNFAREYVSETRFGARVVK